MLSPEAQKAVNAGELKRRARWPKLGRITKKLVLQRPTRGSKKHMADFATYVKKHLPTFTFHSGHDWWIADLSLDNYELVIDAFTLSREVQVNLSTGVEVWAQLVKNARRTHERYAEAGGQPAYSRQANAAFYREKAAQVDGKLRGYYLRLAREREKAAPDSELSCSEWIAHHGKPCGGLDGGCRSCPAE